MLAEPLFGVETEYAFTHFAADGQALPREEGLERVLHCALARLESLRDARAFGAYLGNGSRLYVDVGNHPELSTPECSDPREVVRYIRAGERILEGLAQEVEGGAPGSRASFFRCNVDYESGQTWGCHESYLHSARFETLAQELIPHLASRLIYTGAGGFDNRSGGLDFRLSPRVAHLDRVVGSNSVENRGIVHTKDEPLCGGGAHRLHLLCGESQCSELGSLLKLGATALVVRLIEAGVCRGEEVALRSPVAAMRGFASDPHCTRQATLRSGDRRTALEIQRHYLRAAEAHLSRSFLPAWADRVCAEWRRMLDRLAQGPEAVSKTLDWGIKYCLFREHARRRGFDWESLADWSRLVQSAERSGGRGGPAPGRPRRGPAGGPIDAELARLGPLLAPGGAGPDELRAFLVLRAELFEIDTRFGELGAAGIFACIDEAGALGHRVLDPDSVARAVAHPPSRGRAHARGEAIRQLCSERSRYLADWQQIVDRRTGQRLDLSDPFGRDPAWTSREARARGARSEEGALLRLMLARRPSR